MIAEKKTNGFVDYFTYKLDEQSGILQSITWSFKGAPEIVKRCGCNARVSVGIAIVVDMFDALYFQDWM